MSALVLGNKSTILVIVISSSLPNTSDGARLSVCVHNVEIKSSYTMTNKGTYRSGDLTIVGRAGGCFEPGYEC